jgi:hypothetical protein
MNSIDRSLAGIDTETWQPVASSSRPANNYVPEVKPPAPLRVPDGWNGVATVDLQPVDVSGVMESANDSTRDSTSAVDRAWGYNIRLIPALLVSLLLATLGTVAFVLAMRWTSTPTDALTNTFVFLLCIGVTFLLFAVTVNRSDYAHSRAGVERHRISTAAELRKSEIAAMLELRREALGHTLALLETQEERRQLNESRN